MTVVIDTESEPGAWRDALALRSPALPERMFSCVGKEVLCRGHHFADCRDDSAAFYTATALNSLHRSLPFDDEAPR